MKECPLRAHAAIVSMKPNTDTACIGDKCAWWVDACRDVYSAHHCGLIGRMWGRDDREQS
jgi:hypothetical protein